MKPTFFFTLFFVGALFIFMTSDVQAQQSRKSTLAGYKHKPPVSTSGSGSVTLTLKGDTLTVQGKFKNLTDTYSGGHIMVSLRGEAGNQLYRLKANLNEDDRASGTFEAANNKFGLSEAEKELLENGELYINVSSYKNRKGELRGNIGPMKD